MRQVPQEWEGPPPFDPHPLLAPEGDMREVGCASSQKWRGSPPSSPGLHARVTRKRGVTRERGTPPSPFAPHSRLHIKRPRANPHPPGSCRDGRGAAVIQRFITASRLCPEDSSEGHGNGGVWSKRAPHFHSPSPHAINKSL